MAKTKKEKKDKTETKRKMMEGARDLFTGEWLTSVFFGKHKFAVLLAVALLVLYISYKYEYQTRMREITTLKTELAKVKSESIRQKSLYRSNIRESEMVRRIHDAGLDLRMQPKPPYELKYED
ncbi:MAG: hypothetical protein K2N16_10305 [Muribaculaceae bacterium]|nr:hypothetical protein [Muribaculaceae bacterium]